MYFDQRTQRALREVGLETDDLRAASEAVIEAVEADAAALEAFSTNTRWCTRIWRWPTRVRPFPNTRSSRSI